MTLLRSATPKARTCTRSGSAARSRPRSPGAARPSATARRQGSGFMISGMRTHATLLLQDREPIKTVSERLGHASVTITLTVYGHVMPGDQKRAADRFAALIRQA
jgi:integrase